MAPCPRRPGLFYPGLLPSRPRRPALSPDERPGGEPRATLSALDAAIIIVGVVLGVGIFRSPSVVAANAGGAGAFVILWLVGGAVSLAGALCYAELATAFPDTGGEYSLVSRAYGDKIGFFVAWARMAVIQTGAIGIQSYVFADFSRGLPVVGDMPPVALAASAVIVLTALNVAGLKPGKITQYVLTAGAALTLAAVIGAGFAAEGPPPASSAAAPDVASGGGSIGLALVFVLLAFGGWNEGAYVSAEVEDRKRGARRALIWGTGAITVLYVLANVAYLRGLGIDGVAGSSAVAADLIEAVVGPVGSHVVRFAIILAALSSANAILMTGARSTYALGRDWAFFRVLGSWGAERQTPTPALLLHGAIALLLVFFGALQRSGFEAAVAYTAPVYWLTLLLTGGAVIVLRRKEPEAERSFRVPLYPLTPIAFCAAAAYMVYSSVRYAGLGSILGVAVLVAGIPFLWVSVGRSRGDVEA